jgi:hypothetical protein
MNIWEIVTINDLIKILKEREKRFVIVAITLESTPKPVVKTLKKFLKHYAKLYENLTFLYYCADQKDLGRISLLSKNVDEYPYVYHIFDTSNIFVSVNRANENTIYEAFNAVEEYYKKDLLAFLAEKQTNKELEQSSIQIQKTLPAQTQSQQNYQQDDQREVNREVNREDKEIPREDTSKKSSIIIQNMEDIEVDPQEEMNRKALEHQKLLDKLTMFEDKKKDFSIKILGDIQQRKRDEIKKINTQ